MGGWLSSRVGSGGLDEAGLVSACCAGPVLSGAGQEDQPASAAVSEQLPSAPLLFLSRAVRVAQRVGRAPRRPGPDVPGPGWALGTRRSLELCPAGVG